ncbi:MAG: RNA 2',3'-cyclic phosphodiesterase [Gammaproteobacteria bacterium]
MKRLFFGLWPDANTRQRCDEVAKVICRTGDKPVRADNLHVTLVFLGGVDAETEASLTSAAFKIAAPQLAITFDRLDFWRKPRIVCLTGRTEGSALKTLVAELNALAHTFGIAADERPYTPHVTLIRKAKPIKAVTFEPIIWTTDSFCLVESISLAEGVEYRILKEWKYRPDSDEPVFSAPAPSVRPS